MFDDEDSFFRRPEIIAVLGVSLVVFLGAMLLVLFNASGGTRPTNLASTSPTAPSTTSTTTFVDAAQQAVYGDGSTNTTTTPSTVASTSTDSFGVHYNNNSYACTTNTIGEMYLYDCTFGSTAQSNNIDLYCSGERTSPSCSTDWYPSKLQSYDLRTINGSHYLCIKATSAYATSGDEQCAKYSGGDPTRVSTANGLKCSPSGSSVNCDNNYFPSELNNLTVLKVNGTQYVCRDTANGSECYRWNSASSPKAATQQSVDLYCDKSQVCKTTRS